MRTTNEDLSVWLCLVGEFGVMRLRPVWGLVAPEHVAQHYRQSGQYEAVFLVRAVSIRHARKQAQTRRKSANTNTKKTRL